MGTVTSWDFAVLDAIIKLRNDILTPIMKFMTILGNNGLVWIIICILLLIHPKTRRIGIYAAVALAIEHLLGEFVIKNIIARERPFTQRPWIDTIVAHPSGYSFPSGHTASSTAAAVSVFLHSKKLGIPMMILAVMIMFSRLYFAVHFPTDILCGIIYGTFMALIVYFILERAFKRRDTDQ